MILFGSNNDSNGILKENIGNVLKERKITIKSKKKNQRNNPNSKLCLS